MMMERAPARNRQLLSPIRVQVADREMAVIGSQSLSMNVFRVIAGLVAWSATLTTTLSIANLSGNWGHAICGPWGCGPPLQALISCHLSWFVVLVPAVVLFQKSGWLSGHSLRRIGTTLCVASVAMLVAIIVYERLTWWPLVGESQRDFFWNRCGFVVATTVDVPTLQLFAIGAYLYIYQTVNSDQSKLTAA
ncbi:MAG: hypothetical protein AB7G28_01270 [Pirellulales bacterium]